jgi:hypothetical protein
MTSKIMDEIMDIFSPFEINIVSNPNKNFSIHNSDRCYLHNNTSESASWARGTCEGCRQITSDHMFHNILDSKLSTDELKIKYKKEIELFVIDWIKTTCSYDLRRLGKSHVHAIIHWGRGHRFLKVFTKGEVYDIVENAYNENIQKKEM